MPPRDGARPCASRSASHSSSELDADSVARGASETGAEGAEGPEASADGCDSTEAAWRARETRERRRLCASVVMEDTCVRTRVTQHDSAIVNYGSEVQKKQTPSVTHNGNFTIFEIAALSRK